MGAPYSSTTPSGYNSNPPADDGSTAASNQILWSTIKTKIGDPLDTFATSIDSALVSAFGKVIGGAGVTSTAVNYTVQSSDQGKLVRATASCTVTTPDATIVASPFVFAVLNNSSSTVTLDGNGSQTVDGSATQTVPAGGGCLVFTDGTNWFTNGLPGIPVGKELMYGEIINGTIAESNATNAVTYTLQTLAGATPSSSDPVIVAFRNATLGTGNYVYRQITAATTLTISSGSTLGASNSTAFKVWLVLFDDGGTMRLGAINCVSGTNIYPLGRTPRASSTAEGGAGAADSAQVFYTGTAVTNKSYVVLGHVTYSSGLATAGSWNVSPDVIQLHGVGEPLPGDTIQTQATFTGASATGTTVVPFDDTIPQSGEGDQYMSQAITPTSAANILRISSVWRGASTVTQNSLTASLFQDSGNNALASGGGSNASAGVQMSIPLEYEMLAATTSSTTFKIRAGGDQANTTTFNGSGGARKLGGVFNSFLRVLEIVG